MDLGFSSEHEAFRDELREFIAEHRAEAPPAELGAGDTTGEHHEWQAVLIEQGYAARTIPKEYGGFGAEPDLLKTVIIEEEFRRAGLAGPMANQGVSMLVPTLLQYGSEQQKRTYVPPTVRGEMVWCQGYSETGAGSDLANLRTSAVLEGTELVVNGHKLWTSTAREAQMMFALVRTEPEASKHAGISYLLIDMASPGIEVRPLKMMTGAASFNEVFFEDVRVPEANLVGQRGQGWEIGTATLVHERDMLGSTTQTETMLERAVDVLKDHGALADPAYRQRLAALEARALAMKYHGLRMLTDKLKGRSSGAAGLITKLNGCQLNHEICRLAIDAMGERGTLQRGSRHVREEGVWQGEYMFTLGLIIGGGTAQIQKNIIAERGLGMPREPRPERSKG